MCVSHSGDNDCRLGVEAERVALGAGGGGVRIGNRKKHITQEIIPAR